MKTILLISVSLMLFLGGKAQYSTHLNHLDFSELVKENVEEEYFSHGSSTPIEVNSFEIEPGLSLEFAQKGNRNGLTLLFIHGISDSWKSFEKVLSKLPEDYPYNAMAVTLRGHGGSSKPNADYSIDVFADDIARFIRMKKLGRSVIIGHSLGGMVAQQLTIENPDLVAGLVIVGSDAKFSDNPGLEDLRKEINSLKTIDRDYYEAFQKSTIYRPIDKDHFETFVSESEKTPLYVFRSAMNGVLDADLEKGLSTIKIPALIIWGDKDMICPEEGQLKMQRLIQGSKLIRYKETGHALHWEVPDQFLADLTLFIDKF